MVATIDATIDNRPVQIEEGTSILDAARRLGINIPTLCYFRDLNDSGSCRVCVVEIEGQDQLAAACNTPVEEGMVIATHSVGALKARKTNVELLLSQHNVECTNCVRSGTCELQEVATDLNIIDSRFPKYITEKQWPQQFPLIRDEGKCIKCLRCVQVCDKVQAVDVWDLRNRATRTSIGVRGSIPIEESLCTLCGQCITHCPVGALRERDDTDRVLEALADPEIITMVQIAPSVRVAWGEALGLEREKATVNLLVATLREMGIDYIFDTDFAADLTIMEEGSEFLERLSHKEDYEWPMYTSCCPGWVRYLKGHHPEQTPNLSTAKSPQQMFGATAKTWFAEKADIDPNRIFSISIMPCLAKKHECEIPGIDSAGAGRDVDVVLTVRELDRLIKAHHIDPASLEEAAFDNPLGTATGAGVIFGATGGVMEAALRSAYALVTGENPSPDAFTDVRGKEGWREKTFDLAGTPVRIAVASGLANAEALINAVESGEKSYDFVEIMACPGGCIGGGGQPIALGASVADCLKDKRTELIYNLDAANTLRFSHENPAVQAAYKEYFSEPLSERSHHLLHTEHENWSMPNEK